MPTPPQVRDLMDRPSRERRERERQTFLRSRGPPRVERRVFDRGVDGLGVEAEFTQHRDL